MSGSGGARRGRARINALHPGPVRPYSAAVKALHSALLAAVLLLPSCAREPVEVASPEPTLRRLTYTQYANTIADLLGPALVVPPQLEPDVALDGYYALGASLSAVSTRGVEQYAQAAYDLASQALVDVEVRDRLVPCTPAGAVDAACARTALEEFGRRAWRRTLTPDELERLTAVATGAAEVLGDFDGGLEYGVAAILMSPHFIYRAELGEPDPDDPTRRRFTDWEMASRLSYFLWNTTPDDELLAAAAQNELTTEQGLSAQAQRLLASPRAHEGVSSLFTEMLLLHELDDMTKDATRFVHWGDDVAEAARQETLRVIEDLVFVQDTGIGDLLTTPDTFLNRKLASIYEVRAPSRDGFGPATFDASSGRRGFLGQLSFLALNAHPVSSSATLRGKFVRERLLCQSIPDPPSGVDTSIPEPSGTAPTLRDRVGEHLADPTCAGCHRLMDPIGLGFENFDALGRWRTTQAGAVIDSTGELDGEEFDDAWQLASLIRNHDNFAGCVVRHAFRYAAGHHPTLGERPAIDRLTEEFGLSGQRMQDLLLDLVLSPAFRQTGDVEPRDVRLLGSEASP